MAMKPNSVRVREAIFIEELLSMSFWQSDFGGGSGWVIFGTGMVWYGGFIPCTKIKKKWLGNECYKWCDNIFLRQEKLFSSIILKSLKL